ncbi:UNKNOWN [Stylonychia lemnae]|uniref:Uncharacterized protein n=1 Tax=Stylonychia lemnae TaxID=5949 RepID=A0A078AIH4_STYLE|nr:UNKNOWN [Stylonychia lemnae]|eukprot:CDW81741.1 UNKNOWN [Stylonychia lemnae]
MLEFSDNSIDICDYFLKKPAQYNQHSSLVSSWMTQIQPLNQQRTDQDSKLLESKDQISNISTKKSNIHVSTITASEDFKTNLNNINRNFLYCQNYSEPSQKHDKNQGQDEETSSLKGEDKLFENKFMNQIKITMKSIETQSNKSNFSEESISIHLIDQSTYTTLESEESKSHLIFQVEKASGVKDRRQKQNILQNTLELEQFYKSQTNDLTTNLNLATKKIKRRGRPYVGDVQDVESKETNVCQKRSIFRDLKKMIQNNQHKFKTLFKRIEIPSCIQQDVEIRLNQFQNCSSYYKITEKTLNKPFIQYFPIIGDVCYKFNRLSKEAFFKDKACAYIFLHASEYLKKNLYDKLQNQSLQNSKANQLTKGIMTPQQLNIYINILEELTSLAEKSLKNSQLTIA